MIHGPCGARNPASPCIQNGKCTKKYPRELIRETLHSDKGYPLYRQWAPADGVKQVDIRTRSTPLENQPGVKASDALGRVYTVHVTNLECFCLRMLLHHVRGPTSFTELKIVNGQECQTYREACEARRLLENDNHWDEIMEEAVQCRSPDKIRELYAIRFYLLAVFLTLKLFGISIKNTWVTIFYINCSKYIPI
ncbi:ATP-dependent DNA helicase [Trichonephila clavipes]|nr:ATP-dependent DNA helicase [Trichonephila clavipes]